MKERLSDIHQSQLAPSDNKFHVGNGDDGKHYWLTPPELYAELDRQMHFDFDPCPYPLPEGFDGLTCEWGESNYVNPPFGSIVHQGKKKGMTAWVRKAIAEHAKGKSVTMVYPIDKWVLMLIKAGAEITNLGDVRWLATEDGSIGKGTGRHIACFKLKAKQCDWGDCLGYDMTCPCERWKDVFKGAPFDLCRYCRVYGPMASDTSGHIISHNKPDGSKCLSRTEDCEDLRCPRCGSPDPEGYPLAEITK